MSVFSASERGADRRLSILRLSLLCSEIYFWMVIDASVFTQESCRPSKSLSVLHGSPPSKAFRMALQAAMGSPGVADSKSSWCCRCTSPLRLSW
eukprot:scaffold3022_cov150-Pinguiococcus_pyrenoidosus.AAC.1